MRTGLGAWFTKDVSEFLKHGHRRVGSTFGSIADVVINNSTSYFSDNDIDAIAAHLQSLPATSVQRAVVYDNATADALRNGANATWRCHLCERLARAAMVSTPRASALIRRLSLAPWRT